MAVIYIPNQPLKFIEGDENFNQRNARLMWDRREYCQLVKNGQTQKYQFRVTEDSGDNLIGNGFFTSNINGWTVLPFFSWFQQNGYAYTLPQYGVPPEFGCSLTQGFTATSKTLKLSFDVKFFGDTRFDPSFPTPIRLEAFIGTAQQIGGQSLVINQNGSYTSYWRGTGAGASLLSFNGRHTAIDSYITLDNVQLVELTEPILVLEDCNGNYIRDINIFERFEDKVTITHYWSGADNECYRLCLYGGDDLSLDYLGKALCILDGRNQPILDEKGDCVKYFG